MPHDSWPPTLREATGSVIAVMAVGAICWSALYDGSEASATALVGACGAVTGWLFRGSGGSGGNGNGNGNGTATTDPAKPVATP